MEQRTTDLLRRLDAIAGSVAASDAALAVVGLGSVGTELSRIDASSDLDFFVIVEPDHKRDFIESLAWLEDVSSVAFSFQNTEDGHKVLFEDGIYAEFAVFTADEVANIPVQGGRVVWQAGRLGSAGLEFGPTSAPRPNSVDWLIGEILTNLYVGLMRLRRGERLSAERLIQGNAVDKLIELWSLLETPSPGTADPFDSARRIERRFPETAKHLPDFVQGYQMTAESALAILGFLESHFPVNAALKERILEAARDAMAMPETGIE